MLILRIVTLLLLPCYLFAQQYQKIHYASILVDTHNDIPSSAIGKKLAFDTDLSGKTHADVNRMFNGAVDTYLFTVVYSVEEEPTISFCV